MKLKDKIAWPEPGNYVIACSGGVDSAVLQHVMAQRPEYKLVAAYIDHGWRDGSVDQAAVRDFTRVLGVSLETRRLDLASRSEADARAGRYAALEEVRAAWGASAVLTAHHLDDRIETAIINVMRGTGRRGLSSLRSGGTLLRPLLAVRRKEIEEYARANGLKWVEDPTNQDVSYLRNRVRLELLPRLRSADRGFDEWVIDALGKAEKLNTEIDEELRPYWKKEPDRLVLGPALVGLTAPMVQEVLAAAINDLCPGAAIDARAIEQLAVDLKTGRFMGERRLGGRLSASRSRATVSIAFKAR